MKKPNCGKCREENPEEFKFGAFLKCISCEKLRNYEAYKESKRLFVAGEVITEFGDLLRQDWVMMFGRSKHIEIIKNFQFGHVVRLLEGDAFRYAIRKDPKP